MEVLFCVVQEQYGKPCQIAALHNRKARTAQHFIQSWRQGAVRSAAAGAKAPHILAPAH